MTLLKHTAIYKCDCCGKEGEWGEGWLYKLILHDGWDEQVHVCSQECAKAIDKKAKRKRNKK